MIFVKNSHFVWDPTRQRRLRKKLGNLIKSPKNTLDDMLEEHLEEVTNLLLEKKSEFEEQTDLSSRTDEGIQAVVTGLKSPPFGKYFEPGFRQESASLMHSSPRLPAVGLFGVPSTSPRSPRSPSKRSLGTR